MLVVIICFFIRAKLYFSSFILKFLFTKIKSESNYLVLFEYYILEIIFIFLKIIVITEANGNTYFKSFSIYFFTFSPMSLSLFNIFFGLC